MIRQSINISTLRREYTNNSLRRINLTKEPIELFEKWLKEACLAQLPDAAAMTLSTIDINNQPYQRLVLLKEYDYQSMVFYTNLNSRKAIHIKNNPRVSLHFSWNTLERQVLVLGLAEKLPILNVIKYFYNRPRNSQISACISQQSKQISTRNVLEIAFLELKKKLIKKKIPLPSFWGGYRVIINAMEFWQGRENRLHDRFFYHRKNNNT